MPKNGKAMWDFSLSANVQMDYEIGMLGIGMKGTSSSGIQVKCDLDRTLQPQNETVDFNVACQGDAHIDTKDVGDGTAEPTNGKAAIEHFNLSRNFDTGLPGFTVDDNPSTGQPKNSLYIDIKVQAPMVVNCDINFPGVEDPPPQTYPSPMLVQFDVPYDPSLDVLQDTKDLNEIIQKMLKTAPVPGKVTNAAGTAVYSLNKKNLELKYGPTGTDIAAMKYQGSVGYKGDKHVCYNEQTKTSWLVHSNMSGKVLIDGDVQPQNDFLIWRLARSWRLDAKGKNISNHGKAKPGEWPVLERGWIFDSQNPMDDWTDNAALPWTDLPPDQWTALGILDEFLVGVLSYPEFGFIYTAFVLEMKKNAYRIKYKEPESISLKRAQEIYNSTKPQFKNPFTTRRNGWTILK
jgi:hypothetical protein